MIIETKNLNMCYGCFACANACPKNCITLEQNEEGFFMPKVDESACIHCGLCDKVCIIGKKTNNIIKNHSKKPKCYYGYINDENARRNSASGGLSYALSSKIILDGGISIGVVGKWFEDVHHACISTIEDLNAACLSKYVQSRAGNIYRDAKNKLEKGINVLFTGTPCQIAALYSFLGKDYDNLLTADLICHGVPSKKFLCEELSEIEAKKGSKLLDFVRNKKYNFSPPIYIASFQDGSELRFDDESMYFRKGFNSKSIERKSCGSCKFSSIPRIGDISMGDMFYGVGKKTIGDIDPKNIGVSLLSASTEKGKSFLLKISDSFTLEPLLFERAKLCSNTFSKGITESPYRDEFFKTFTEHGLQCSKEIIDKAYVEWRKTRIKDAKHDRIFRFINPITFFTRLIMKFREIKGHKN